MNNNTKNNTKAVFGVILVIGMSLTLLIQNIFFEKPIWDTSATRFGATSYPTSLDALTNPASTDSVATVSHSGQHSNANDAIEAIEAKMGITASTPFAGSVLVGNGGGTSLWSSWATTTNINTTNLEVSASSTIQNITLNNATSTNATTTTLYSSGNIYSNAIASTSQFYGAKLTSCTGSNFLNWTGGNFSCGVAAATITSFATTTSVAMATATIPTALIPSTDHLLVTITASTTEGTTSRIVFNSNTSLLYSSTRSVAGAAEGTTATEGYIRVESEAHVASRLAILSMRISNFSGRPKTGFWDRVEYATSTVTTVLIGEGGFYWNIPTDRITNIDFGNVNGLWGAGTHFEIVGY